MRDTEAGLFFERAAVAIGRAEANRHRTEIKRIEEEKRQLSMTTEERVRDVRRQGMTASRRPKTASARLPSTRARPARRWPVASSSRPGKPAGSRSDHPGPAVL